MHCGAEVTESSTNKQHHLYTEAFRGSQSGVGFVCFITAGPITKLFAWGGGESGHVL